MVGTAIRNSTRCAGRRGRATAGTTSAVPDCSTNHDSADRIVVNSYSLQLLCWPPTNNIFVMYILLFAPCTLQIARNQINFLLDYQNIYWNNISLCWVIDISYGRQYWFRGIPCPGSTTEPQDKLVNIETTRLQHSMDSTSHKLCTQFGCALLWLYHTFPVDGISHKICTQFCCALLWLYHTFPVDSTSHKICTQFGCALLWLYHTFPAHSISHELCTQFCCALLWLYHTFPADSISHELCTQFGCALLWLYHTFPADSISHKICTPFCCALLWLYHTFPADSISHKTCSQFCCALLWLCHKFPVDMCDLFTHILQGCFTVTGAIIWLPQCQWSNPEGYG